MNLVLFKTCKRCNSIKPVCDFNKDKRYNDGLQSWCKACYRAYHSNRKHQPMLQQKRKEYMQKWYQDHIEKRQAANQAYCRMRWHTDKTYRDRKNKQGAIKNVKRRMKIKNSDNSLTLKQWQALCEKYQYRCLRCGEQKTLTIDHIVPLSRGGNNSIGNVQPLCRLCNGKKATKTIDYR